jgi:hypothetical protein
VLLINLTSVITELAKNLILSGVSLYLYDKKNDSETLITEKDIETNFFISEEEIGKNVKQYNQAS